MPRCWRSCAPATSARTGCGSCFRRSPAWARAPWRSAAYLAHPVLGKRLRECAGIVAALDGESAGAIFSHPDELKFHSSMTLFADVAPDEAVFQACIDTYFDGQADPATLARL
jgi:uncharacterized protein (DUF1810 family)